MDLNWSNLIIQLGIAGLVVFVAYKLAMKWMTVQREAESERTKSFAIAETARTQAIREGFAADIAAHNAIANGMTKLGSHFSRLEGKLDTLFDLTPIREQYAVHAAQGSRNSEPNVIVEEDDTPVERPPVPRQTPHKGTPIVSGEYLHTGRPKTGGR